MTQVARPIFASLLALALWPAAASAQGAPPPAGAPAAASPAPTPTALPDDPAIDKRAKAEFLAWQSGKLDKSHYSKALDAAATDDAVAKVTPQLKALGDLKSVVFTAGWVIAPGKNAYQYLVTCSTASMLMLYVVSPPATVEGVRFRPAAPTQ
jgi:hypothetical protein